MITEADGIAEDFLDAARGTLRAANGADGADGGSALDTLHWWEVLSDLDDQVNRLAAFALFRAQGRELAGTPALGALLAQPYLGALGAEPGSVVAAIVTSSPRKGEVAFVLGGTGDRAILLDLPGRPLVLLGPESAVRERALPGRLALTEIDIDSPGQILDVHEGTRRELRLCALVLGRIAAAAEMLGCAEAAVELATEHARLREQFGEPIGRFQAVRHLLAWATTDTVALAASVRQAVHGLDTLPPHYDEIVKALAGRNARSACERSLQVLGGIGFTAEHEHHHHHARVLLIDSLLGPSAALTHQLGSRIRETGLLPEVTQHALSL